MAVYSLSHSNTKTTRRSFLTISAARLTAGAIGGTLSVARSAHAEGDDTIKIALVGCGNRGTGACSQALNTKGRVKLLAMADAFRDRIDGCLKNLGNMPEVKDRIDVPEERKFVGFNAYQQAIDCGVNAVLLITPPAFRPIHYAAAIKAGKHVFMEKPLCVDAPGDAILRGRLRSGFQYDRHSGSYGDILGQSRNLGRGRQIRPFAFA